MANIQIPDNTPALNHSTVNNHCSFLMYNDSENGSLNLITLNELKATMEVTQSTLSSLESEIFNKIGLPIYNIFGNVTTAAGQAKLYYTTEWQYAFTSNVMNRTIVISLPIGRRVCYSQGGNNNDLYYRLADAGVLIPDELPNSVEYANQLTNMRSIDGVFFDGSANIYHYARTSTEATIARKNVIVPYSTNIANGCRLDVYFVNSNTVVNPTIAINDARTTYPIFYKDEAVPTDFIKGGNYYSLMFYNNAWNIISATPPKVVNTFDSNSRTDVASASLVKQLYNQINTREGGTTFENIESMVSALNAAAATEYGTTRNLFVVDNAVPNFWITTYETTAITYTYTTDAALISDIETNGEIQVGYFKISKSKTNVDISTFVEKTQTIAGISLENDITTPQLQAALNVKEVIAHVELTEADLVDNVLTIYCPDTPTRFDLKINTVNNLTIAIADSVRTAGFAPHNLCINNNSTGNIDVIILGKENFRVFSTNVSFTINSGNKVDVSYQKGRYDSISIPFIDLKVSLQSSLIEPII